MNKVLCGGFIPPMKVMKKKNPSQLELTFKSTEFQTVLRLKKSKTGSGFCDQIQEIKSTKKQHKPQKNTH